MASKYMIVLAQALLVAALATASQDAAVPLRTAPDETSLKRIRGALAKSAGLRVNTPVPTFRIEVREHPFFTEHPTVWDFAGGGVPTAAPRFGSSGTPPLVVIDLLPLVRAARKAYTQHAASTEVRRALTEFCSTHSCSPD
jgi:hypothetical protein